LNLSEKKIINLLTWDLKKNFKYIFLFNFLRPNEYISLIKIKNKVDEDRIRDAIEGMHYIPVYREIDGIPHLGIFLLTKFLKKITKKKRYSLQSKKISIYFFIPNLFFYSRKTFAPI
jgi:hypothetical protein